jgi:hypothetical protein
VQTLWQEIWAMSTFISEADIAPELLYGAIGIQVIQGASDALLFDRMPPGS